MCYALLELVCCCVESKVTLRCSCVAHILVQLQTYGKAKGTLYSQQRSQRWAIPPISKSSSIVTHVCPFSKIVS